MFCTVNDCEIQYESLDESKPILILPGLLHGQVQVFSVSVNDWSDTADEPEGLN